jgi:hypothetical protein
MSVNFTVPFSMNHPKIGTLLDHRLGHPSFSIPLASAIFHAARHGNSSLLNRFCDDACPAEDAIVVAWVTVISSYLNADNNWRSWMKRDGRTFRVLSGRRQHREWAEKL